MVGIAGNRPGQTLLIPAGITLRTEEDGTLVVVNTVNCAALPCKKKSDFRTDETGGTCDEDFHGVE